MHTPGLKVVMPSTPYDAKGLLLACIDDEDPCVFIESTALFMERGMAPTSRHDSDRAAATRRAGRRHRHRLRPAHPRRAEGAENWRKMASLPT